MYKLSITFLLLFSIHTFLRAQTSVEWQPKTLLKELERINGESYRLSELAATKGLSSQSVPGRFFAVSANQQTVPIKFAYVGRVKTCRSGGCTIDLDQYSNKESEFFDYFILYDSSCTVRLVKIYNYQATHGQEVTAKSWLKQFIGYQGEAELYAGKNIDAISGATISVNAINYDIEYRTGQLKQVIKQ